MLNNVLKNRSGYVYTGHEDYFGYNRLWKQYLTDDKIKNIDNIHIASLHLTHTIIQDIRNIIC